MWKLFLKKLENKMVLIGQIQETRIEINNVQLSFMELEKDLGNF